MKVGGNLKFSLKQKKSGLLVPLLSFNHEQLQTTNHFGFSGLHYFTRTQMVGLHSSGPSQEITALRT